MKPEDIIAIRNKLGVTQEKFAQMLGATTTSVNRWENGKVIPSRLYVKEIKELSTRANGSYLCRRKKSEGS